MRAYTLAKESVLTTATGPVKKLVGQDNVPRDIFFLQAADRGYRNDPPDTKGTQGPYMGPVIELMGKHPVPAPVTWQEKNTPSGETSADNGI